MLSRDRIRSTTDYIDQWLAFRTRHLLVPGAQVAILVDDDLVLSTAYGVADATTGTPMTTAHLFRIASHSKTFTAVAVMQLCEAGTLRLDDPIGQWVPALGAPGSIGAITVGELLMHSSGITRDGHDGDFWQLLHPFPGESELLDLLVTDVQVLPRNERFKYSNIGFGVLGLVITAAAGVSYHDHVASQIIDRLGLGDTSPEYDTTRAADYAAGHTARAFGARRTIPHVDTRALASPTGFSSTASDVCRWAAAQFFGDERVLTDASKRIVQRTQWDVGPVDDEYGMGFRVATIGDRRMIGHGGGYPGHITATLFDPVERLAASVLTNAIDGPASELLGGIIRLIERGATETAATPVESDAAARFVGRFANLWQVVDVVDLGGRLTGISPTAPDPTASTIDLDVVDGTTLRVVESGGYGARGELWRYERDDDGTIVYVRSGGGMSMWPYETPAADNESPAAP